MKGCLSFGNVLVVLVSAIFTADLFAQSPTSPALNFNIFTENNLTLVTNESEGPVAAGGDLIIAGTYQVAIHNPGTFTVNGVKIGLLVGGKVNYQSGNEVKVNQNAYIKIGNSTGSTVWYYDQNNAASPIRITPNSNYNSSPRIALQASSPQLNVGVNNNPVFQGNLIDFAGAFNTMRKSSASLAECPHNVVFTNANGQVIPSTGLPNQVRISLIEGVNVMNISGADLNNIHVLNYNQRPSASRILIVNVDAPGTFNWNIGNQTGVGFADCPYVLYNFYNTTSLSINGATLEGTVFAPFADVTKPGQSNIEGQLIAKSFQQSGGQMHYAIFAPSVPGCAPVGVAPTANFEINQSVQCLVGNTFEFTNTSVGDNISYSWDFGDGTTSTNMNPVKTYASAGTYTVTLTATNSFGTDDTTFQVTVNEGTAPNLSQTTVSSGSGSVVKQFVLNNSADFTNAITWNSPIEGDGFLGRDTAIFTFTDAGYYEVLVTLVDASNGCEVVARIPVVIASNEVNTGNDGGLESESLGDAVSKRYVRRKIESIPTVLKKTDAMLYDKSSLVAHTPSSSRSSQEGQTLVDMFPASLMPNNTAHITSPTDILDYTVAQEVLSVDFSEGQKTKGVVLGIRTANRIYNHTKASCDRLKGAEILHIQPLQIQGYKFLMQAIKQRNGVVEYAISFAVGKNMTDNHYSLQSNWYVTEYSVSDNVYNFQVWATLPEYTQKLVGDILDNLSSYIPVVQAETQKVPKTYISKIERDNTDLILKLKSTKANQSIEVTMDEVYSETNGFALRYNPILSELEQTVRLEVKDGYEYEGLLKVDGEIQEAFYHADGNWGLDFDPQYTTINQYTVYNNFDRVIENDELPVHRNVKLMAHSEYDYLTLYKALLPGSLPADYTDYQFVSFTAKGSGLLDVGLVKSSVDNWGKQYKVTVNVKDTLQTYYIPFELFKSTISNSGVIANDLTTLTFSFLPAKANTTDLDLTIEDVKFTKVAPAGYEELLVTMQNEYIAYPNPTQGNLNCLLYSESASTAIVSLTDIMGRLVYSSEVSLVEGRNDLKFDFSALSPGIMFLNISGTKTDYGTSKVILGKQN